MAAMAMVSEVNPLSLVAATRVMEDALFGLDARRLSGDDAAKAVEMLARHEKICAAKRVQLASRAAECDAHRKAGCSRPSDWLAKHTGQSSAQARRELELASKLEDHPDTKAALENGEVSLDQADEAVKTDEACPGTEKEILDVAKRKGLGAAREKGRRLRQGAIPIEELERQRHAARDVHTWTDELGMLCLSARLLPEVGARLLSRLEAETEREWKRGNRQSTYGQRAHDAFVRMFEGKGRGPTTRAEVVLVWNLNDDTAHIPGQGPVPVKSALDLAKEAVVSLVLHDGVKVDSIIRYSRGLPPELRTLIEIGAPPDFDGAVCSRCGGRFRLQKDHMDPKNHGGPLSLENLDTLCPVCHGDKTKEDWEAGLLSLEARVEAEARRRAEGRGPP